MNKKIILLVASSLLTLVVSELLLAFFIPLKPLANPYFPRHYLIDDKDLGFRPAPLRFSNNSLGCLDREHEISPQAGGVRILGVGDSQTWGSGVSPQETYLHRLEAMLNEKRGQKEVDVFACGVPGYASDQAISLVGQLGQKIKPRVAILGVYCDYRFGDVPRLLAHKKFGVYRVYAGFLVPANLWSELSQPNLQSLVRKIWFFFRAHSRIYYLASRMAILELQQRQFWIPIEHLELPSAALHLEIQKQQISRFVAATRTLKAAPVIVIIPSSSHFEHATEIARVGRARLIDWSREIGITVVDLYPRFSRHLNNKGEALYFDDGHMTSVAHLMAAEELSRSMLKLLAKKIS